MSFVRKLSLEFDQDTMITMMLWPMRCSLFCWWPYLSRAKKHVKVVSKATEQASLSAESERAKFTGNPES